MKAVQTLQGDERQEKKKAKKKNKMHRTSLCGIYPTQCNSTGTEVPILIYFRISKINLGFGTRGRNCALSVCLQKGYVHFCVQHPIFQSANQGQDVGINTFKNAFNRINLDHLYLGLGR